MVMHGGRRCRQHRIDRSLRESPLSPGPVLFEDGVFPDSGQERMRSPLRHGIWILAATAGKVGGTFLAARLTSLSWRESAGLAVLMNTRGLMELIILNVGLDLKIISPTLFAMMVLMALVTTLATAPVLHWLIDRPHLLNQK